MPRPFRRLLATGLTVSALAGSWFLLAPLSLRGQDAYVATRGDSMTPGIVQGDLVIARAAEHYEVGDVIAFHSPLLGIVLHRVITWNGDQFTTKGDHNASADSYHPRPQDIVGRMWVHVHGVGRWFALLRSPRSVGLLVSLLGALSVALTLRGEVPSGQRGRRRGLPAGLPGGSTESLLLAAGLFAVAALVLGVLAWRRPLQHTVSTAVRYGQAGTFSYTAESTSDVYGPDGVSTGDPIYMRLVSQLNLRFDYQFTTQVDHVVGGQYKMAVVLALDNGWKRTVNVDAPVTFKGDSFSATVPLDLTEFQSILDALVAQTGVAHYNATLTVTPAVTVAGTVAEAALRAQFTPALSFQFDPLQLVVRQVPGKTDLLSPTQPGSVRSTQMAPNPLPLLSWGLPVETARLLAVAGLLLALFATGLAMLVGRAGARAGEIERIQARYGALLLPVQREDAVAGERVVEVTTFAAMVKVATQLHSLILHTTTGVVHCYSVLDGTVVYVFMLRDSTPLASPKLVGG